MINQGAKTTIDSEVITSTANWMLNRLEAAFLHSRERHVTVVSPGPPKAGWRRMCRQYKKRIIHIPLKRFSAQTIEKVRRFHVLNGKHIRSFATRFIQDI